MKVLLEPLVAKWLVIVVLSGLSVLTMVLCSKPLREAGLKSIIDYEIVTDTSIATGLWQDIGLGAA